MMRIIKMIVNVIICCIFALALNPFFLWFMAFAEQPATLDTIQLLLATLWIQHIIQSNFGETAKKIADDIGEWAEK